MKAWSLLVFCFYAYFLRSQDKIYYLSGTTETVMVSEIAKDYILIKKDQGETKIPTWDILLIEFKSGAIEIINTPENDAVFNSQNEKGLPATDTDNEEFESNFLSLNTLALVNFDIAGFYEKLDKSKKVGFGAMAAYNFNTAVSGWNFFIAPLPNSKKKYEVGLFANYYPGAFKNKTTSSFGCMIKYNEFSFIRIISGPNGNVRQPANGKQLALLLNFGTHTILSKNFFIKTSFGMGGFSVNGAYKDELNNQFKTVGARAFTNGFLPKIYIGINAGFSL